MVKAAVSISDLERLARRRLPRVVFDYLDGGAEDETTLRANRNAFSRYELVPRMLTGHHSPDLSIRLFGKRSSLPFLVGPTGLNGLHWTGADTALARAAAAAGTIFTLSTASNVRLEDVASTSGRKWYQLYAWGNRSVSARLMQRARAAGYEAMMVTVDSLVGGKRERDARNGFSHELRMTPRVVLDGLLHPDWLLRTWLGGGGMPRFENVAEFLPPSANAGALAEFTRTQRNADLCWNDIAWMKEQWGGPFLVKGILSHHDIALARAAGVDGVIVSNHGGRQLDGSPATLDVLPSVVEASGPDMPVLIDGGIRRGSDVVKAIALGAHAVLLGRATLYGVAAGGEAGATRAIAIIADEVKRTLQLLGVPSIACLSPAILRDRGVAPVYQ